MSRILRRNAIPALLEQTSKKKKQPQIIYPFHSSQTKSVHSSEHLEDDGGANIQLLREFYLLP